jgi:ABC-2 type transport system permease protein
MILLSARRTWAMARKETLHIIRDGRSLGMAIAMPMLLLLLFGYALTLDVDRVPLIVWDQDQTQVSRDFVSRFTGSRYFSLRAGASNYSQIERAIDSREALVALVIPMDFAAGIATRRQVPVQMIVDGSDSTTATIAIGYAEAVTQGFSQEVVLNRLRRSGGPRTGPPLEVRPRVWFNEDMSSRNYIVPGLIAVIMMVIAALLTSLTVAREWERGTMEQLISTPVKGWELIAGKLLPYFAIGMLDVSIAMVMGELLFQVPLRGSAALVFAMAAVFLAGALSMGILISIVTKNQLVANQLAVVTTFVPSFLLSGFMYAIANMPQAIQVITYAIPARYFVALLKGIYLKGVGLEILGLEAGLLTVFGIIMALVANFKFKKKLT